MKNIKRTGIGKKGMLSLQDLINFAKKNPKSDEVGAIATFTGVVRGYTHEGDNVEKLELEAYEEVAEHTLQTISDELRRKPGIVDVLIHHLIGTFTIGEEMVYVVVTGRSRKEVFSTLITAVERYKHEVPLWKKEYLKDGKSYWISEK
jgi:molybdopterin synthase catalytic subunit